MLTEIIDGRIQISTRCDSVQVIFKDNKEIYPYQRMDTIHLLAALAHIKFVFLKRLPFWADKKL